MRRRDRQRPVVPLQRLLEAARAGEAVARIVPGVRVAGPRLQHLLVDRQRFLRPAQLHEHAGAVVEQPHIPRRRGERAVEARQRLLEAPHRRQRLPPLGERRRMLRHAGQHAIETVDRLLPSLQSHQADAAVEQHGRIGRCHLHGRGRATPAPARACRERAARCRGCRAPRCCRVVPARAARSTPAPPRGAASPAAPRRGSSARRRWRARSRARLRTAAAPPPGALAGHAPSPAAVPRRTRSTRRHRAQSAASAAFFLSVISIEPGLWVMQIDGRAASIDHLRRHPAGPEQRQLARAASRGGSPKSGRSRSRMPIASGRPRCTGAPCTAGKREVIWMARMASAGVNGAHRHHHLALEAAGRHAIDAGAVHRHRACRARCAAGACPPAAAAARRRTSSRARR